MLKPTILNFFLLANVFFVVSAEVNLTPGSLPTFRKDVPTQYYSKEYEQVSTHEKIVGQIIRSVPLNACSEISIDTVDTLTPPILIAVKGECELNIKALNAKLVGAKLLIIVDNEDMEPGDYEVYGDPIESNHIHTDKVIISNMEDEDAVDYVLISKTSGQKIIEAIEEVNEVETGSFIKGTIYFNEKYDENVEIGHLEWQEYIHYEIQVQPSERRSIEFLKEFKEYYDLLQGFSSMKIRFSGITTGDLKDNCFCGVRYCGETEGDLFNFGTGIVLENLRHLCIIRQYDMDTWWQYMSEYADYCLDDTNIQECSTIVLRRINLDPIEVESCMRTSFDQNNYQDCTYNPLLEEILDISSSLQPNVIIGDTIWPIGDLLSAKEVFKAICQAFNEMPQACQAQYNSVTHSKHSHNPSPSSGSSKKHSQSKISHQTSSSNSSNSESPPFISAPQSNLTEPSSSQSSSKQPSQSLDSNFSSNQHSAHVYSRPKTASIQPSTKKSSAPQILPVNSSVLEPTLSNSSISISPSAQSSSQTTLLSNHSNQTYLQPALSGPSSSESSSQEPPQLKSSDSASSASQASSLPKDPIQGPSLNETGSQNSPRSQSFQTNGSLSSETSTSQNISSPRLPNSVSLPSPQSSSQNSSIPDSMNPGTASPQTLAPGTTIKNSSIPVAPSIQSESPGLNSSIVSNSSSTQTLSQNSSALNNSVSQPSLLVPQRGPAATLPQNSSFSNTTLSGSPDLEPSSRASSESESSLPGSLSNQTPSFSNSSTNQTLPQRSPTPAPSSQEPIGTESLPLNSTSNSDDQASNQSISTVEPSSEKTSIVQPPSQNSSLSGPAVPQSLSPQTNNSSSEGSSSPQESPALQSSSQEDSGVQSSSLNSSSLQTLPSTSQIVNSTLNTSSSAQTLSQRPLSSAVSPSQPLKNGPLLSEPSSSGTSSLQPLSQDSQASGQNSSLADPSSTQALPQDSSVPSSSDQGSSISDTSTSESPSEAVSPDASSDSTSAAEPTGSVSPNGLNSHSFVILISVVCVVATGLLILILYKSPFISTAAMPQAETGAKPSGAEYVALEGNFSERLDHQNAVVEDNLV